MVGSQNAAGSWNGEGAAGRGRLRRCSLVSVPLLLAAWLVACSGATPPPPASAPVPVPAVAPAPAPSETPQLTGLSEADLLALYGEPDFRRVELPAELWQYRSAACVLDVFLYRGAGGTRVIHTETRDRGLIHAAAGRCTDGAVIDSHVRQSRL